MSGQSVADARGGLTTEATKKKERDWIRLLGGEGGGGRKFAVPAAGALSVLSRRDDRVTEDRNEDGWSAPARSVRLPRPI